MKLHTYIILILLVSCELIGQQNTFDVDCEKDFWTITSDGIIQKWSLEGDKITGGEIIVSGGGLSLAFCGEEKSPTFFTDSWNSGAIGINYFDENLGWINIPTTHHVQDNGGHLDDHFCTVVGGVIQHVNYWNGSELTVIDSLPGEFFAGIFDVAVDTDGHAWIFTASSPGIQTDSLKVYNSVGQINSYSISFNMQGYGSFFLNETLYIGTLQDSIYPILINGNSAQVGSGILFPSKNFTDMASCQFSETPNANTNLTNDKTKIYPNPTTGTVTLLDVHRKDNIAVYDLNGRNIPVKFNGDVLDLTNHGSGIYYVHVNQGTSTNVYQLIKL